MARLRAPGRCHLAGTIPGRDSPPWPRTSVEELAEPALLALAAVALAARVPAVRPVVGVLHPRRGGGRRHHRARLLGGGAVEDLVQLATVQPHPPAAGAVVDLDAVTLTHG